MVLSHLNQQEVNIFLRAEVEVFPSPDLQGIPLGQFDVVDQQPTVQANQVALPSLIIDIHHWFPMRQFGGINVGILDNLDDAISLITRKLRLAVEIRVVGKLMSTTYMTENGAATAAWNAASGVDIEGDIDVAKLNIRKKGGVEPNTVVIPPHIAVEAKKDSAIRDLVKYTDSTLLVNGELPPRLFGLEVVIPLALYDEAAAGSSSTSLDFAWDDNSVLVAYVERQAPSKRSISLAYQFRRPISGSLDIAAFRYREDGKHATVVEGLIEQTEEVVCAACGYLITGAYS